MCRHMRVGRLNQDEPEEFCGNSSGNGQKIPLAVLAYTPCSNWETDRSILFAATTSLFFFFIPVVILALLSRSLLVAT